MKILILKSINLLALLLSTAWLARAPDWEPAITTIGLLATLIGQEALPVLRKEQTNNHDRELFKSFLKLLPSNGQTVNFLKNHNMGDSFYGEVLVGLETFLDTWDNAEHEFKNRKIEKQRKLFLKITEDFYNDLSENVYPKGTDFLSMNIQDFEDRPEVLMKMKALNKSAKQVYYSHQELVRLGLTT